MLDADLAPLLLELALWGTGNPAELSAHSPTARGYGSGERVLTDLGALNTEGQITTHGRQMAELAATSRLAHMLLNLCRYNSPA